MTQLDIATHWQEVRDSASGDCERDLSEFGLTLKDFDFTFDDEGNFSMFYLVGFARGAAQGVRLHCLVGAHAQIAFMDGFMTALHMVRRGALK